MVGRTTTSTQVINHLHFLEEQIDLTIETLDQPEPRPEPLWTVPFQHDPDFVSRNELLAQIHKRSSIPGSRIVIFGIGGVG